MYFLLCLFLVDKCFLTRCLFVHSAVTELVLRTTYRADAWEAGLSVIHHLWLQKYLRHTPVQ